MTTFDSGLPGKKKKKQYYQPLHCGGRCLLKVLFVLDIAIFKESNVFRTHIYVVSFKADTERERERETERNCG